MDTDRRQINRWPLNGAATGLCLTPESFGATHDFHLIDYGDGGVGTYSRHAIHVGTVVSLGFEPLDYGARQGRVVACTSSGSGHRIAIRFEGGFAA